MQLIYLLPITSDIDSRHKSSDSRNNACFYKCLVVNRTSRDSTYFFNNIIIIVFFLKECRHNNTTVEDNVDPIQDNVYVRTVLEFKYNSCV